MQFFSDDEAGTIEVLAERIFPATDDGPGATAAGVVSYLDAQLASGWGTGDGMYRHGPFVSPDHAGHGWQSAMTPSEAYRYGLAALDRYAASRFDARSVKELDSDQVDALLLAFSQGAIDTFTDLDQNEFFAVFLHNVAEGLFCDPAYGGNRDLVGWKWMNYPGDPDAYGEPYVSRMGDPRPYNVAPAPLPQS